MWPLDKLRRNSTEQPNASPASPLIVRQTGSFAVTLGCDSCAHRTTVTVPSVDNLKLNPRRNFPISVVFERVAELSGMAEGIIKSTGGVSLYERSCPGDKLYCDNGDAIASIADDLRSSPHTLEAQFSPQVRITEIAPPGATS